MAKVPIAAILWRRVNQATFDSLRGESKGQYDIRLTALAGLQEFFAGVPQVDPTDKGGYTLTLTIAPFEGPQPIEEQELRVRYMGPRSERRDWYIASQRPDTAYPLWRVGRAFDPAEFTPGGSDFVVLIRDVNGSFHARWVSAANFSRLPPELQSRFQEKEIGIWTRPDG